MKPIQSLPMLVAGVVCSIALLLRSSPLLQSLTCESETACDQKVQTTKGEDADNRIGDQVKTVCVVRGNRLYRREDGGEGEG